MDIYLIRHTSVYNPNNICYGQSDVTLSNTFNKEAKAIKNYLCNNIQIISSPSIRCVKLSEYMSSGYKNKVIYDNRLLELNFGLWEGVKWSSIPKNKIDLWSKELTIYSCPEGESYNDLYKRAVSFWCDIIANRNYNKIAVITHSGVIRSILSYILNIPLENSFTLNIDFSSITNVLVCNDLTKVNYINYNLIF